METLRQMLGEFEQMARTIGEAGLDDASWTQLRGRVIDLIQRGHALGEMTDNDRWTAIHWDETDAPVLLARGFSMVHRRLAAAPHGASQAAERTAAA